MEYFDSINKVVNFSHEAFHENNFRETNAHVPQFSRESLAKMVKSISENLKKKLNSHQTNGFTCMSLKSWSCMAVEKSSKMCVKFGHLDANSCRTVWVINSMGNSRYLRVWLNLWLIKKKKRNLSVNSFFSKCIVNTRICILIFLLD